MGLCGVDLGTTIWLAGVVDVAREIFSTLTVNSPFSVKGKDIFSPTSVSLFGGDFLSGVLNNTRTSFQGNGGRETDTTATSLFYISRILHLLYVPVLEERYKGTHVSCVLL